MNNFSMTFCCKRSKELGWKLTGEVDSRGLFFKMGEIRNDPRGR